MSESPTSTTTLTPCEGPPGQDTDYPLQRCDVGLAVAVLKQELTAKGYLPPSTANDGRFDDQVVAAVRAFQTDHGLVVDGLVGPLTWAAITAEYQRLVGDPNGDGHLDPAKSSPSVTPTSSEPPALVASAGVRTRTPPLEP